MNNEVMKALEKKFEGKQLVFQLGHLGKVRTAFFDKDGTLTLDTKNAMVCINADAIISVRFNNGVVNIEIEH